MSLCEWCASVNEDCKGTKDHEMLHCQYYKKPIVFNVREAAERIAELEKKLHDNAHPMHECVKPIQPTHDGGVIYRQAAIDVIHDEYESQSDLMWEVRTMKKYRAIGHTTITCSMVVEAESYEEAIEKANQEYGDLTNYIGNGGDDKLIGPVDSDDGRAVYPDSEIIFDDAYEEDDGAIHW